MINFVTKSFKLGIMYTNAFNNETFNLSHITNRNEVEQFANYLVNGLNINFHPDTPFEDYIEYDTKLSTFTPEDAAIGNQLMDECFEVCNKDDDEVYFIMGKYLFARIGIE